MGEGGQRERERMRQGREEYGRERIGQALERTRGEAEAWGKLFLLENQRQKCLPAK